MGEPKRHLEMPFAECPWCDHRWQLDDWYFLVDDDRVDCPECGGLIIVDEKETTVTFTMRRADGESKGAG